MIKTINEPVAKTFGWLHANGVEKEITDKPEKISLKLGGSEEKTVVLGSLAGGAGTNGYIQFKADLGKESVLKLIQITSQEDPRKEINEISVHADEDAEFEWYRIVLPGTGEDAGTAEIYDDVNVDLSGAGSRFKAEIGYSINGGDRLNINCEAVHTGKKTESAINCAGVLADDAFKLLRGTIDLRTGAEGAVGNEKEDVLLMDDTVHNQSVPVILCSEENVEGNHGATIGRLDEEMIYYLGTRGIDKEAAYDIMSRAKVEAVIRRIPDEGIAAALLGDSEEQDHIGEQTWI